MKFKSYFENKSKNLIEPTFQEGETNSGNRYAFGTSSERGEGPPKFIYVASSRTWIKSKGITVTVLFEGQGRKDGDLLKSIELSEFEKTAKSICLSVK
jgi:hypothetical protein